MLRYNKLGNTPVQEWYKLNYEPVAMKPNVYASVLEYTFGFMTLEVSNLTRIHGNIYLKLAN